MAPDNHSIGDAYTFVALERHSKLVLERHSKLVLERHSKLVLAWHLGRRTKISTFQFLYKLRNATTDHSYQLTSDGFRPYIEAVDAVLPRDIDFAQLVKVYATSREGEQRYSPGDVVDAVPTPSSAILIRTAFALATLSGKISRCGCR
jgi:hypothetical protein